MQSVLAPVIAVLARSRPVIDCMSVGALPAGAIEARG
jgi:hypothetical protein